MGPARLETGATTGTGWPPARTAFVTPRKITQEHRPEKCVCRNHEEQPGFANAAKIYDRDHQQNAQANRQRVRLKFGNGGNERADSRGNADRRREHVVEHQCSCRQQSGVGAEVLRRDGVGAASARIRRDRLPVRKINDRQEHDDADTHRQDIRDARGAERNQQSQGGFGAVRRRAQRIKAKDRNSGGGADLLGALVRSRQRLAEKNVNNRHEDLQK